MSAYSKILDSLAEAYPKRTDWERVATTAHLKKAGVVMEGSSITVWTNILRAAQEQRRLGELREVLNDEQKPLLDLYDEYAKEAEKGDIVVDDTLILEDIALQDGDLKVDKINKSLHYDQIFPARLLNMCLSDGQPELGEVDAILRGVHTAEAQDRLNQFRHQQALAVAPLQTRRKQVEQQLDAQKGQISSIEGKSRPFPPNPRDLDSTPEHERSFWVDRNRKDLEQYKASLAHYEAEQTTLPALREKSEDLQREIASLDAEIAERVAQGRADERAFEEDIAKARDADFQLELRRLSQVAANAFNVKADPFTGTWALIGTSKLLDVFVKLASQPAAATEAGRAFREAAEALIEPMQNGVASIVRGCFAGPTVIRQSLMANQQASATLMERLAQLPSHELELGRGRAEALLSQPLASIPSFATLERPDELEETRKELLELKRSTMTQISALESDLKAEPAELRSILDSARADVEATTKTVAQREADHEETLRRTTVLWALINWGAASTNLPTYARRLCRALSQELAKRLQTPVNSLLEAATNSALGLQSLRVALEAHLFTRYLNDRARLQERAVESLRKLEEITATEGKIDYRYVVVARRYRRWIIGTTVPSFIPGAGLLASLGAAFLVNRLMPLMNSDKAAYIQLASFVRFALAWAVAGAGLSCGASTSAFMYLQPKDLLDFGQGTAALSLTIASYIALAVAIRNLLSIKAALRKRRSSEIIFAKPDGTKEN